MDPSGLVEDGLVRLGVWFRNICFVEMTEFEGSDVGHAHGFPRVP
jgi:hypothetical protein